jgi:hypothetical protein
MNRTDTQGHCNLPVKPPPTTRKQSGDGGELVQLKGIDITAVGFDCEAYSSSERLTYPTKAPQFARLRRKSGISTSSMLSGRSEGLGGNATSERSSSLLIMVRMCPRGLRRRQTT